ncbi:porimin [Gastrophryne carolinensis]
MSVAPPIPTAHVRDFSEEEVKGSLLQKRISTMVAEEKKGRSAAQELRRFDTPTSYKVLITWLVVVKELLFTIEIILQSSTTVVFHGRPAPPASPTATTTQAPTTGSGANTTIHAPNTTIHAPNTTVHAPNTTVHAPNTTGTPSPKVSTTSTPPKTPTTPHSPTTKGPTPASNTSTATTKATEKSSTAAATTTSPNTVITTMSQPFRKTSGFDLGSFIGGIVLTMGILVMLYFGCRYYNSRRGVRYRTIDEHEAII